MYRPHVLPPPRALQQSPPPDETLRYPESLIYFFKPGTSNRPKVTLSRDTCCWSSSPGLSICPAHTSKWTTLPAKSLGTDDWGGDVEWADLVKLLQGETISVENAQFPRSAGGAGAGATFAETMRTS